MTDSDFWGTLEEIRNNLQLNESAYSQLLDLPDSEYFRLRSIQKSPSVVSVMKLARHLNVAYEDLVQGEVTISSVLQ